MTAKDFLEQQIIPSIEGLVTEKPFIAFALMSIGIEFLGNAMQVNKEWGDDKQDYKATFRLAILKLFPKEYNNYNQNDRLYYSLRCGFAHNFIQKPDIILSAKEAHHTENGKLVLGCKQFFLDFKAATTKLVNENVYNEKISKEYFETSSKTGNTGTTYGDKTSVK